MNSIFHFLFLILSPIRMVEQFMLWGGGGGKGGGGGEQRDYAAEQRERSAAGQKRVDSQFAQFDEPFYEGRKQAYINFYEPEFERQKKAAHDKLVASLATRNLLASSQGAKEESDFARESDSVWGDILSGANTFDQQGRSQIASAKANLYGMAGNTDDAVLDKLTGEQVALSSAAPQFSSVGQLFANLSTPAAMGISTQGGTNPTSAVAGTVAPRKSGKAVYSIG